MLMLVMTEEGFCDESFYKLAFDGLFLKYYYIFLHHEDSVNHNIVDD